MSNEYSQKVERRRKILLNNTIYSTIGYLIAFIAIFFARLAGFATYSYFQIFIIGLWIFLSLFLFVTVIGHSNYLEIKHIRKVTILQLINWLLLWTYTTSFLNEIRILSIFLASIALIYLLSTADFRLALFLSILVLFSYTGCAFFGIKYFGQQGDLKLELFYLAVFFPSSVFLSVATGKFAQQRQAILAYKRNLEEMVDQRTQKLEHELIRREKAERQLVQAQKMEAIGTLAGGIAHDFNNILATVSGYTELARDCAIDNLELVQNLDDVLIATERARILVQHILTFSRQSEVEFKPIHLSTIITEAVNMLRSTLPAKIEIQKNIQSDSTTLGEATQISQILMNLGTNAFHAMGKGGGVLKITVSDKILPIPGAKNMEELPSGPYIEIKVSDTGCGMTEDIIERIFDPFFTTKPQGEGTGIGLATVHGIVESHRGKINVTSQTGVGTEFIIYLPIHSEAPLVEEIASESYTCGTESILFVDDERSLVEIGKRRLTSIGYNVTTCISSVMAVEMVNNSPETFDLVITDLNMPIMSGTEVIEKIKALRPDIPVILCTGHSEISSEEAKDFGIDRIICKPVSHLELTKTIRHLLDSRSNSNHNP